MKPIPIKQSPTRSRALNVFLGMVLTLFSILLFLALATYHPTDSSMNTASGGGGCACCAELDRRAGRLRE